MAKKHEIAKFGRPYKKLKSGWISGLCGRKLKSGGNALGSWRVGGFLWGMWGNLWVEEWERGELFVLWFFGGAICVVCRWAWLWFFSDDLSHSSTFTHWRGVLRGLVTIDPCERGWIIEPFTRPAPRWLHWVPGNGRGSRFGMRASQRNRWRNRLIPTLVMVPRSFHEPSFWCLPGHTFANRNLLQNANSPFWTYRGMFSWGVEKPRRRTVSRWDNLKQEPRGFVWAALRRRDPGRVVFKINLDPMLREFPMDRARCLWPSWWKFVGSR